MSVRSRSFEMWYGAVVDFRFDRDLVGNAPKPTAQNNPGPRGFAPARANEADRLFDLAGNSMQSYLSDTVMRRSGKLRMAIRRRTRRSLLRRLGQRRRSPSPVNAIVAGSVA